MAGPSGMSPGAMSACLPYAVRRGPLKSALPSRTDVVADIRGRQLRAMCGDIGVLTCPRPRCRRGAVHSINTGCRACAIGASARPSEGRSQTGSEAQMSPYISVIISVLALMLSFGSAVLSFRADRRARESVRPYVSTGVHMIPGDMSVSLSNYGAGVAIVTKMSMNRNGAQPTTSLGSLLPPSANYQIQQAIDFVQEQYFLRPGDEFPIVAANARPGRAAEDAVRDWSEALEGIRIEIDYLDIFGKTFRYARAISTRA